ncbi:endonuclease/exonuclease/phosphatase family protein [Streptomyces tsukubensis]|uniref:endonuclease/exonuclease/phosphatase family protein n=1 Tax=Streptomyces tsukubensis TaxID=83656 RepID=UPI0036B0F347
MGDRAARMSRTLVFDIADDRRASYMDSASASATSTAADDAGDQEERLHDDPDRPRRGAGRRIAAWCAALLLIVPTVVVACRVADTDAVTPIPQLLAFLPWLLVPAGAALLLAALARWIPGLIWAVVVLAITGWFVRPYDIGLADKPSGKAVAKLEVLTSNVEFGNGTEGLLELIEKEQPDLVFVTECAEACSQGLATRIPLSDYPHRNVVEGKLAFGSAILSKYPLKKGAGIESTLAMPGSVATIAGQEVQVQLAHPLPPVPSGMDDWHRELGRMKKYAAGVKDVPTIFAGDFNAGQDHAAFRRILDAGKLRSAAALGGASRTPSWPTMVGRPLGTQIDHVLISKEFSVRKARFVELDNTDHRALLTELELHEKR